MGRARRENSWCAFAGLVVLLVVVSSVIGVTSSAQYYTTGADPLHLRWYRLSGDLWRIDADSLARPWGEAANGVLTDVAPLLRQDFTTTACRSVDVVVHSRTGYSNGLVSWAPRRLEAYAYDNGQEDCVPWVRHLLTHEYRHVLQISRCL